MNTIREILKINEEELERGLAGTSGSWHANYSQSAWVYVGNLDHALTEGDIICVMSQFGEIEDLHLVREEDTGKSRGFAFCKYEDARSCVLAVDNLCGIELCGRSLRVDHVENYRLPKHLMEQEEEKAKDRTLPGHAYQGQELANKYSLQRGQDLFAPPPPAAPDQQSEKERTRQDREKEKKREAKRQRKEERQRKRQEREERRRQKRARKMKEEEDDEERHKKKRKKERHRHHEHDHSPTQRDRPVSARRDE